MFRSQIKLLTIFALCASASCAHRQQPSTTRVDAPRLVISLTIDQFGAREFQHYYPLLDDNGLMKTVARRGAVYESAAFDYAATYTAPGHTTLYCGGGPSTCGIVANRVWDETRGIGVPSMDGGRFEVFGNDRRFASPIRIAVPTVADALKKAHPSAKVVSISMKDRAAIPAGGQRPDLVLWYDARAGGFTTSKFYAPMLPAWLARWNERHPAGGLYKPWVPSNVEMYTRVLGWDKQPGEGHAGGLTNEFPHVPTRSDHPTQVFKMTPQSTSHLLDTALEAATAEDLGADHVPDLLAVSVSAVDYAGHIFGPDSWEYLDTLIAADRMLGAFVRALAERTSVAVLVTSDHGVTPFPEREPSGRIHAQSLVRDLNKQLQRQFGSGEMVVGYMPPYLYLSNRLEGERRAEVLEAVKQHLNAKPSIHRVYDTKRAGRLEPNADEVSLMVARSIFEGRGGDLFVVPARGHSVVDGASPEHGTSHGSPWESDRVVPVLLWGPGVTSARISKRVSMNRVAPTLSWMLGVAPPPQSSEPPLRGLE